MTATPLEKQRETLPSVLYPFAQKFKRLDNGYEV